MVKIKNKRNIQLKAIKKYRGKCIKASLIYRYMKREIFLTWIQCN